MQAPFAQLLSQSQSAQQPSPPETALPSAEPAASAEHGTTTKPRAKLLDKATAPRAAERQGKTDGRERAKAETPASDTDTEASRATRAETNAAEPSLAPWLLALQHPTEAPVIAAGTTAGAKTAVSERGEGLSLVETGNTSLASTKPGDDAKARLDPAVATQPNAAAWAAASSAESAKTPRDAELSHEEQRDARPISTDAATSTAALGAAGFNPLVGSARDIAAPLAVNVPTPLASPEFAQALGVQVSVLVADGVQRAELQLNPAEMGPVSVQIVIDGTRAHVDFGADLAATRQAIESGLPQLAGALSDAGFTLTGGGVSQHAGGRSGSQESADGDGRGKDKGSSANRGLEAGAVEAGAQRLRRTVAAGGLDLYA